MAQNRSVSRQLWLGLMVMAVTSYVFLFGDAFVGFLVAHWRPGLLVGGFVLASTSLAVALPRRGAARRKAAAALHGSRIVLLLLLAVGLRPFLPSHVLLWNGCWDDRSCSRRSVTRDRTFMPTVYNTMPCHFNEPSKYFNGQYRQELLWSEEWRHCLVPVNLFDGLSGLRKPSDPAALSRARLRAVSQLSNATLREWLQGRGTEADAATDQRQAASDEVATCPENSPGQESGGAESKAEVGSYLDREFGSGGRGCLSINGVWCCPILCESFCKVATMGLLAGFREGEKVFDWGAGCGHTLSWLQRMFGEAQSAMSVEEGE